MATWCAWCKPMRKMSDDPKEIETHGICGPCKELLIRDLKRSKDIAKFQKAVDILGPEWAKVLTNSK